jgi:hypothetical protein
VLFRRAREERNGNAIKEWRQYFEGGINRIKPGGKCKYMYHLIEHQQNSNFVRMMPLCVDLSFTKDGDYFFETVFSTLDFVV